MKWKIKLGGGQLLSRSLGFIERVGNALPHPATLFGLMALGALFLSGVAAWLNITAVHPATGEIIRPENLMSIPGLHRVLTEMVTNFTGFAPLGTVLVAMLGIGIAEGSGTDPHPHLHGQRRLQLLLHVRLHLLYRSGRYMGY